MELNELKPPINAEEAVSTVSKEKGSAWMIIAIVCVFFMVGLFLWQNNKNSAELKREKKEDAAECKLEKNRLRSQLDSLYIINEHLHDSLAEYRIFKRYNIQTGKKEIIITPKKTTIR